MLKNCKGYFLLEVLLSLGVLIAAAAFLPALIKMREGDHFIEQKREAAAVLHDEIQSRLYDQGTMPAEKQVVNNGRLYTFTWKELEEELVYQACVSFEHELTGRKAEICHEVGK
ncbi:type II secretion system protein [Bacillus marinisedimentorum]|uniref:type II secretion system protein n=1 Tax=Bacillus marinisedimentorum TaxID=1821260 RepID=UPI000872839D|nr:type II secretion system protein [Bacillus marinisedimentorum]